MIKSLASGQKSALIVNECQVGILDPEFALFPGLANQAKERNIVPNIVELLKFFRAKSLPVFFTPVVHRQDFADENPNTLISAISSKQRSMAAGSPEVNHMPGLEPQDSDFVVTRTQGLIAFLGTSLDATLRRLKVETVVLTGVSTNVALAGMSIAATEFGYNAVIPEDCTAGADPETHKVLVENQLRMVATITTKDDVISTLS